MMAISSRDPRWQGASPDALAAPHGLDVRCSVVWMQEHGGKRDYLPPRIDAIPSSLTSDLLLEHLVLEIDVL